jgi:hypothetical protein
MARGKHSAALFEVINSNSRRSEKVEQSLSTPKWWFKGRQTPTHAPLEEPSFTASDPIEAPPAPMPCTSVMNASPLRSVGSRSSAVHLDFDRDRKEITLRLRYTTAVVSAFGVCVLIGLAYVVGGHMRHGPQTASAAGQPTIQQLLKQPPQAGVIVLNRQRAVRPVSTDAPKPVPVADNSASANIDIPRATASLIPAGAETRLPRTIGLNYAIVQTYPPEETQIAQAACEFLNSNGIPCSLETTDYVRNPRWLCLVGTAGFTKISSQDYKGYVDNIIKLGEKFPSSHFDRFKPAAYKWKG